MPRRTLVLVSMVVLALHWLLLSSLPLARGRAAPPADRILSARLIAMAPPPPVATPLPVSVPGPAARQDSVRHAVVTQFHQHAPAMQPSAAEAAPVPLPEADTALILASAAEPPAVPTPPPPDPAAPEEAAQSDTGLDIRPPDGSTASGTTPPAAVRIPAPMRLAFDVTGQARQFAYHARAELLWQHDGSRYQARQEVSAFLLGTRTQTSVGRLTPQGLLPERFTDRSRSEQTVHFDHARGRVTFGEQHAEAGIGPGAQDRLGLFMQLGALLAADPQRFVPGTRITLTTVSARSAERWTFSVVGPQTLDLPVGPTPTLKLQRLPRSAQDQQAELWLAPALDHLPVRIRLTQANGDFADLQLYGSSAP